jgi:hypothetical protein
VKFQTLYPYRLDWGKATADGYEIERNEIMLIFNCNLSTPKNIVNVIQYVVGRISYGILHFPENSLIKVTFDLRGQEIIMSQSNRFREQLFDKLNYLNIDTRVSIDFIR